MLPQEKTDEYLIKYADFLNAIFQGKSALCPAIASIILVYVFIEGFIFAYFPLRLANLTFKVTFSLNLYSFERYVDP